MSHRQWHSRVVFSSVDDLTCGGTGDIMASFSFRFVPAGPVDLHKMICSKSVDESPPTCKGSALSHLITPTASLSLSLSLSL
eukprot:CAMPEP_0175099610 /NCGR_PEP_ID=MMETSP0086_2-20121207/6560_1 /TAXON_ID=136419 /ORGANISM="Unknown Unknown, Strain D1" /LENGTH=81 /DNA_ID=CAMNT_0016373495 /DNA_START=584 /DNA_END=826 /DNA_ORIENTATION=+